MTVRLVVLVILSLALSSCALLADVSGTEARSLVEQGARLIDVRTPGEFADGHIAGAINIPKGDLEDRLAELEPKDQPLILYCASGFRSWRAQGTLEDAGFTDVRNLGGMSRWE